MEVYLISNETLVKTDLQTAIKNENNNKYWMIFTPDELKENFSYFNFTSQSLFDCLYNEDSPKIEIYENYSFGIINIIGENEDLSLIYELNFYLTKNYLIFVNNNNLTIINEIKEEISNKGTLSLSFDKILYILFDKMTIKDNKILSKLEIEILDVEEDVLQGKTKDYIYDIVSLKKKLLLLKRHYEPLLDIIEDLSENENNLLKEESIRYFTIIFNRIERLNRKVSDLRDNVTQIRESYQSQIDMNVNNIMKIFTVITSIFLPLTLIVGWYGMNFVNMPELKWKYGYLFVILISVLVLIISLLIFKKKKWL
ncbi:MAG: CorA family divalent cation transporter [Tissierellia bacterium]|nr:CorA family divalent cation transporter [Tissierellia bacterium]MDD4781472.1 CorA family divalent cation transporter [Tissierellia bacterium]